MLCHQPWYRLAPTNQVLFYQHRQYFSKKFLKIL